MTDTNLDTSHRLVKKISFTLVCVATVLLILDVIDVKLVFGRTEVGLWDNMPNFVRQIMFIAYPISLLTSYILFVWKRNVKARLDIIANILFLFNGLAIVFLLVIFLTKLAQNL